MWSVKEHFVDAMMSQTGNDDFFVDSYKGNVGLFGSFGESSRESSFLQELAEDSEPLNTDE